MLLRIRSKARARISALGVNVYPLEAFGLLLGVHGTDLEPALVVASLPVGKTRCWQVPEGRFERIEEAVVMAREVFFPLGFQPVGLFCTRHDFATTFTWSDIEDAARRAGSLPWVLAQSVAGGERIWRPAVRHLVDGTWVDAALEADWLPRTEPAYNPRRLLRRWTRAWGVLDCGNDHEVELPSGGDAVRGKYADGAPRSSAHVRHTSPSQ